MLRSLWLLAVLSTAAAWLAFANSATGDWPVDAAPAVNALAHGHLSSYLASAPIMGPFAILIQVPFSLLGRDATETYQWSSFGCLLSAAALGWYLARVARRRGAGEIKAVLVAMLCVVNPLTVEALRMGHPEEILTAALAVGAVAVAVEGRNAGAAVLLGLAIASKQWAVLAIFPVLMALPSQRFRAGAISASVLATLTLPAVVASPTSFFEIQGHASSGGRLATIWSGWYPLAPVTERHLNVPGLTANVHELPGVAQPLTHWLIVVVVLAIPLALWTWRRRFGLPGEQAMALLALLALLRCALDPVDNLYYHAPLLLALLGWDAVAPTRLPLRGLTGAAVAFLFWRWSQNLGDLHLFNLLYLATILLAAAAIVAQLAKRQLGRAYTGGRKLASA